MYNVSVGESGTFNGTLYESSGDDHYVDYSEQYSWDNNGRIVGAEAPLYAWPSIARMRITERAGPCMTKGCGACGGTIVNDHWILTAAHCCTMPRRPTPRSADSISFQIAGHYDRSCDYSGRTFRIP